MIGTDVTVVLNVHREAVYLRPTLKSLDSCAEEAAKANINTEMVVVFDRPNTITKEVFSSTKLENFCSVKTIDVDEGSLGPARNAGIALAEGEFVLMADADDLLSPNAIAESINTVRNHAHPNVVVFMQHLVAFGLNFGVGRYFDSDRITAADFVYQHPYVSRMFARRSVLDEFKYRDLRLTRGFAFEDWDLNVRLYAAGFDFRVARDAIFFYRQRDNSLLRQAMNLSARIIPHSEIFERDRFLELQARARDNIGDLSELARRRKELATRNFRDELLASEKLRGFVVAAAKIEPEVEPSAISAALSYAALPKTVDHWGFQLETLYRMMGTAAFTDVILLPWLKPGGAEKQILQILQELNEHEGETRLLVLCGEATQSHEWMTKLPDDAVFLDVFNSFPALIESERDNLVVRAILSVASDGSRLHLKESAFAHRIMDRFGVVLREKFKIIYYRFCDNGYLFGETFLSAPGAIRFLRNNIESIDLVICDSRKIIEDDESRIAVGSDKYHVIYNRCIEHRTLDGNRRPRHRILWASRVCTQKRPALVGAIASGLRRTAPEVVIDVYGALDEGCDANSLFACENVEYHGAFDRFQLLDITRYDALLYTSWFDGLPNIILEAMAVGMPVIAPDVGGISEAVVDGETGFLVPNVSDEAASVSGYLAAIEQLYADWETAVRIGDKARALIASRHGQASFSKRVVEVLGLRAPAEERAYR